MRMRPLGRTGLMVPPIALGCAAFGYRHASRGWDPTAPEGRRVAVATVEAALDAGVTYVDTAPAYGDGLSEEIVGEVMARRRDECILASKVWFDLDHDATLASVRRSLERLRTDRIDVVQIHGRMYSPAEVEHVRHGGPLDALRRLRDEGIVGHIGITTEEPWTVLPFLENPDVSVFQIAYNLIYQSAARHFLPQARLADAGVVTMRTMTSGVFQREAATLAPGWQDAHDLYEVALKFVLSDSRVHSGIVGMRWPEEVERNVTLVEGWKPAVDLADVPRLTKDIYQAEDAERS